ILLAIFWAWPHTRAKLRRHPLALLASVVLLMLLAAPGLQFGWQVAQNFAEHTAHQRELNPTLSEPLQLGEILFPAGTQVRLERSRRQELWRTGEPQEYGLSTLQEATFASPVEI